MVITIETSVPAIADINFKEVTHEANVVFTSATAGVEEPHTSNLTLK